MLRCSTANLQHGAGRLPMGHFAKKSFQSTSSATCTAATMKHFLRAQLDQPNFPNVEMIRRLGGWEFALLDASGAVVGIFRPPMCVPQPDGTEGLAAYLSRLEGLDLSQWKTFVSVWFSSGVMFGFVDGHGLPVKQTSPPGMDAATKDEPVSDLSKRFLTTIVNGGTTDACEQKYRHEMLINMGTSHNFARQLFESWDDQYHTNIVPCRRFLRVMLPGGNKLWSGVNHARRFNEVDSYVDVNDPRWIQVEWPRHLPFPIIKRGGANMNMEAPPNAAVNGSVSSNDMQGKPESAKAERMVLQCLNEATLLR